jgi:hypothetical protein
MRVRPLASSERGSSERATRSPRAGAPGVRRVLSFAIGAHLPTCRVICVTPMLIRSAQQPPEPNYAAWMTGWRDERVRAAEEALAAAVRTADEIITDAAAAEDAAAAMAPREEDPPADVERSVLRDAW